MDGQIRALPCEGQRWQHKNNNELHDVLKVVTKSADVVVHHADRTGITLRTPLKAFYKRFTKVS